MNNLEWTPIFDAKLFETMIQRIQTIYLALAAICLLLTAAFDFAAYAWEGQTEMIIFGIRGLSENAADVNAWFPYFIAIPLAAGLSVFSILQFKNRKRQLLLGKVSYLILLLIIVMLFIDVYGFQEKLGGEGVEVFMGFDIGIFLPVAALPFVFLANRAIKKDEKLIRSVDRLR